MSLQRLLSEQIEYIQDVLKISPEQIARALGTDPRTVLRWLADENFPQGTNRERLDQLEELVGRLDKTFKTREGSQAWLWSESGYFGGLRPIDALLSGRIDRVDAALEALDSGTFV